MTDTSQVHPTHGAPSPGRQAASPAVRLPQGSMSGLIRPALEQLAAQLAPGPAQVAFTDSAGQVLCGAAQQAAPPHAGSAFTAHTAWSQAQAPVLLGEQPLGMLQCACAAQEAPLQSWVSFTAGLLSRQLEAHGESRQTFYEVISQVSRFTAHALGNPLAGLSLTMELLASNPQSNSAPRFIERSQRIIERLTEFKENLGALGLDAVEMTEVNLAAWFKEVIEAQKLDPVYKLQLDLDPSLSTLRCHPGLLGNALGYLLRNVTDALPDGGNVGVRVEDAPTGLRITVWDEGPGVAEGLVQSLFRAPVSSRKHGGGMGLMLVGMTVEQMHAGTIRYERNAPRGSRFVMELPHHVGAPTC